MSERANKPSASGIPRLVHCPGSWAAEAPFRDKDDATDVSEAGTAIALALESGLPDFLDLTEKQIAAKLLHATEEIYDKWVESLPHEGSDFEVEVIREERLWVRGSDLQPITSAKPDFLAVRGPFALLIDDKTGFKDLLPAESDWQIRTQVIAVKETFPDVKHILAGLLHHRFKTKWDPVEYNEESMEWARTDLLHYLRRAEDPLSPRVPGAHCRYCKARKACPEFGSWSLTPMGTGALLEVKPGLNPAERKERIETALRRMTVQDLAFVWSRKTLAEEFFSAATGYLKDHPADLLATVGLELVPNSPNRSISDIQKCYAALAEEGLITDMEFRELCEVGIGRLEKVVVPRIQARHLEDTKEKLAEDAAKKEMTSKIASAITLIPKASSLKLINPLKKKAKA